MSKLKDAREEWLVVNANLQKVYDEQRAALAAFHDEQDAGNRVLREKSDPIKARYDFLLGIYAERDAIAKEIFVRIVKAGDIYTSHDYKSALSKANDFIAAKYGEELD